jgi:hypothetical protein
MTNKRINQTVRIAADTKDAEKNLEKFGNKGQEAFDKIEQGSKPANKALEAVDEVSSELQGSLQGVADEAGVLGAALTKLGPIGAGLAVTIGAVTLGSYAAVEATDRFRLSIGSLEGVIKATGNTTGLTLKQLDDFSRDLARSTLNSSESVRQAAATLAAFGGVADENFKRTLSLAADMATVFETDLQNATESLGEVMQRPAESLSLLENFAVAFTEAEKEMVEQMIEAGKQAEVQEMIFARLEARFEGVAAKVAGGTVSGAKDGLAQSWQELLETFDNGFGITDRVISSINLVADGLDRLTDYFTEESSLVRDITEAQAEVQQLEALITKNSGSLSDEGKARAEKDLELKRERLQLLKDELQALKDKEEAEIAEADRAQKESEEREKQNKVKALELRLTKELSEAIKEMNKERKKQADEFEKYTNSLEDEIDLLKLQKRSLVGTAEERDKAIKQLRELQTEVQIKNELQRQGIDANSDEAQTIRALIEARNDEKEAVDRAKAATKAAGDAAKKAAEDAKAAALAAQQPWLEAAEGIRTAFVQTFEDIFRTGSFTLGNIGNLVASSLSQAAGTQLSNFFLGTPNGQGGYSNGLLTGAGLAGAFNASSANGLGTMLVNAPFSHHIGLTTAAARPGAGFVGPMPLTNTGFGNFIQGGLNAAPFGIFGSLGANLLGFGGSGNIAADLALQTGGSIVGGGIGSGIGALGAFGGPVGAIAGAFLGTVLGSLFKSKPSDRLEGAHFNPITGALDEFGFEGKKDGPHNRSIVNSFFSELENLVNAIERTTGGNTTLDNISFQVGDRSGVQLSIGDGIRGTFSTVEEAFAFAVQNIVDNLEGVTSDLVQQAIDNLDFTDNLEGAINVLDTVVNFESILNALTAEVDIQTPVERSLQAFQDLEDQIMSLSDTLGEVGITVEDAIEKINEGRDNLRLQFEDEVAFTINELSGRGYINRINSALGIRDVQLSDAAALGASTDNIDEIFRLTVRNAISGLDQANLNQLLTEFAEFPIVVSEATNALAAFNDQSFAFADHTEAINAMAEAEATLAAARSNFATGINRQLSAEQARFSTFDRILKSITAFGTNIQLDPNLSPLSPLDQLDFARENLNELAVSALAGDADALSQFPQASQQFLQASKAFNASSTAFASDFQTVQRLTTQLKGIAKDERDDAQTQINILSAQLAELQGIRGALGSLDDLQAAYETAVTGVDDARPALGAALASDINQYIGFYNDALLGGSTHRQLSSHSVTNTFLDRVSGLIPQVNDQTLLENLLRQISNFSGQGPFTALGSFLNTRINSFASGGIASGLSLVGEQGPELVNFGRPSYVFNNSETSRMFNIEAVESAVDRNTEANLIAASEIRKEQRKTNELLAAMFSKQRQEVLM